MDVRFELQEGGHPESCESIGLKFKGIQVHVYLLCIYIYWVYGFSGPLKSSCHNRLLLY